jgi:hypothetical protein
MADSPKLRRIVKPAAGSFSDPHTGQDLKQPADLHWFILGCLMRCEHWDSDGAWALAAEEVVTAMQGHKDLEHVQLSHEAWQRLAQVVKNPIYRSRSGHQIKGFPHAPIGCAHQIAPFVRAILDAAAA